MLALLRALSTGPTISLLSGKLWSHSSVLLPFQAIFSRLSLSWRSLRPFGRWYLTHWRSFAALSAGSSVGGTLRTSASPWRCRPGRGYPCSLAGNRGIPVWVTSKSKQASLGCCSGGAPYAPSAGGTLHAGAIPSALGRRCLRQWYSSAVLSWPTNCPSHSVSTRWLFGPALLSSSNWK